MDVETPAEVVRSADAAAVSALYRILLGRHPETEAIVAEHEGQPLTAVIALVLQSAEFRQLVRNVEAGQQLPHLSRLTLRDLDEAAAWVAMDGGSLSTESNWWAMIGAIFTRVPELAIADYRAFAEQIERRAHATTDLPPALERMAVFDPDWYRRANRRAELAIRSGEVADEETYFLTTGRQRGDQLLPGFSERLAEIYDHLPADASVAEIARALARATARGISGHWLFSEHHHGQSSRATDAAPRPPFGEELTPYVQYLTQQLSGDARPHPLFCPRSYALLNGLQGEEATFDHYIRTGMFEGFQTSALFEPSFYSHLHPEVGIDILRGKVHNELHHFLTIGMFEDARFSPYFDADFYRGAYPDVVAEMASGTVPSATWHFVHHGLAQGRSPSGAFNADYYRTRYPHIDAERSALGLGSALEHYLLVGRQRGYSGDVPLIERRASLDDGKVIFQRRALRSLDRQSRTPLVFPATRDRSVRLSVIIPVSGQAQHTARLLECAHFAAGHLLATSGVSTQIVVVDNGSRDETARLLAATTGITTIHFPDPIGYPSAIAAGIASVEGDLVLVTNNDVEFEPDAFVRIVDMLAADPTIGMLGGLVVLPNERVQDAGSFVDHEGFTVGVGRHEDPWNAFLRGTREVDYCAGCFFSFRLADYLELGGVDEDFSPGYFEEVDFAFRMRSRLGKRAVVASDIQVVHLEHGSFGSGMTPVATEAVIRRNRSLFLARHARELADRPSSEALLHDHAARPTGIGRQRALVIIREMPATGEPWPAKLLDGLATSQVPFEILALGSRTECDSYADRRVNVLRGWLPGQNPDDLIRRSAGRFSHIVLADADMLGLLGNALADAVSTSNVSLVCSAEALPVLADIDRHEKAGRGLPDVERISLIRAAIASKVDIALWLAATDGDRDLLTRAGARRAVTVDWSRQGEAEEIQITLVGCGKAERDVDDALAWCRASVAISLPRAIRLRPSDILDRDLSGSAAVSVGLQPVQKELTDGLKVVVVPPRLVDIADVLRALGSGLPVLMTDHHRRRIQANMGAAPAQLAIVDESSPSWGYAAWFARFRNDPALVERIVGSQREWLASGDAVMTGLDDARIVALR